jgi:FkbM family methyltransferase
LDTEVNGEAKWLRTVVDGLSYVIDVGANKGDWINLVVSKKKLAGALLVEPSLSALVTLRERYSACPEIDIAEAAAGSVPGTMSFFEEEAAGETSSLVAGFSKTGAAREVRITTVDSEVQRLGWPRIDFLKIDAEGFDFHVLEGARSQLAKGNISFGQFEYNAPWRLAGSTLTCTTRWLQNLGYECFCIKADGLHRPDVDVYKEYFLYSNYAFVRKDLVAGILPAVRSN